MFSQEVTKEKMNDLYNLCLQILTKKADPYDILPTRPGCFFGSTAYDDFYYYELDQTKSTLENLIKNINFETHYLKYQCSWMVPGPFFDVHKILIISFSLPCPFLHFFSI